jgi:hypothetical protein
MFRKPLRIKETRDRTEMQTLHAILGYLTMRGHLAFRVNSGTFSRGGRFIKGAPAGTADIIGVAKNGAFFAIEVKRFGNHMSDAQRDFMARVDTIPNTKTVLAFTVDDVARAGL